jgi:two-component system, LytTR family, sensor kinase
MKKINYTEVLIHLLFWMVYVVSEYFANLMHMRTGELAGFLRATFLSLPVMVIPAYFIALYAVPRLLKKDKWPQFLLSILVVGVFVFFARIKWLELVQYLENDVFYRMPVSKVLKNVIRDYSIIALAICIYIIGDYRKKQKLNEQLVKAKAEAEIKLLKGQLHPHFLFNSLNNIYSLALMKSDLTADSILKLTELLDYLVYKANKEQVALSKEVELLRNYVDLEKLRYGKKLKIKMDIEVQNDSIKVAPLMLLPFAENCFKHGGIGQDGIFRIKILLRVDDKKLDFQIENSKKKHKENSHTNGGAGLLNIQKRLILLYPDRHELRVDESPGSYNVKLELILEDEKV